MNIHDEAIEQILFENDLVNEWDDSVKNELNSISLSQDASRTDLSNQPLPAWPPPTTITS